MVYKVGIKRMNLKVGIMKEKFVQVDRETLYLLPPSIQDWLPEKHLARFVVEIVEQLDLQPLKEVYTGRGSQAYNPEMLVALLFYGYATGVFSSRKLERSTYDSVAVRYIAENTHPDHDTIATFRRRFLPQLTKLFMEILAIARQMKVLKLGTVSIDGTKIQAYASRHKALSYGHACKLEKQLEAEVAELLQKAESADRADIPDGMDVPTELSIRRERIEAIKKAKAEIERRAAERYAEEQKAYKAKMAQRAEKERKTGKKTGGKPPQPPTAGPTDMDQVNLNDGESRIMPKSGGGFEQAYNAQAGVDTESMLIVTTHVTQAPNDKHELDPALTNLKQLPQELGTVSDILADNGYFSEDNVNLCAKNKVIPYIAVKRDKHHPSVEERFHEPGPLAHGANPVDAMKHRLCTQSGKAVYAMRKSTVEPVFGIIKSVMGFRQFLLRGLEAVECEWNLVCIGFNLKRLYALAK
jgi:transposase